MRFALILAFFSAVFVSTEAAAAPRGHKHRASHAAKVKPTAKTAKRSRKAKAKTQEVAVADSDIEMVETDTAETPAPPKVETAPVSHTAVAQATDDEEPPAKKKR